MKSSRPAHITIHRARRAERTNSMEENRKAIINMLSHIKDNTIMRMIREIVQWLCLHQDDLV